MELVPHSPTQGVYPATDDYVHAMEVRGAQRLLFVAGTMGLDANGLPGATLPVQLDLIWANIRTILASAGYALLDLRGAPARLDAARDDLLALPPEGVGGARWREA